MDGYETLRYLIANVLTAMVLVTEDCNSDGKNKMAGDHDQTNVYSVALLVEREKASPWQC